MEREDDAMLTLSIQVPRSALIVQAAPPDLLSQRNVSAVCGIAPRQYLAMLRASPLAVTAVGRLRLVDRRAFVEWIASRGVARSTVAASSEVRAPRAPNPTNRVEVLARKLGGEVSHELAEAAAKEARETAMNLAQMARSLGLVEVDRDNPELDLRDARRSVKWAAQALGDRAAFERFARELGQRPCPTCDEWADDPPCGDCRRKAREAARVPCVKCDRRIDPSKDGLCRRCRKDAKLSGETAAAGRSQRSSRR